VVTGLVLALGSYAPAAGVDTTAKNLGATALTPSERIEANKAPSSRLAETDPDLLARNDSTPVRVMIKLDYDAVAGYAGGVEGLEPTSPSVTGEPLTGTSPAEVAYEQHIDAQESEVVAELQSTVAGVQVEQSIQTVYGGIAAEIPASSVEQILAIDGVVAVQYDSLRQPVTDESPGFVGAPSAYDELGTTANAGQGVIYGNLDSGIWPEHPSFADLGNLPPPPGPARECNYGDNPLTPAIDVFACNNKLIGGAHFTDSYDSIFADDPFAGSARDGNGHGTHTASTTAGNIVESAPVFGVERGPIQGLAPGAYVMEYKVCGPQGCQSSDSAAAVAQAVLDGVDVINFSISGGTDPFTDPVELAFLDAYAAGVFVSASAGNDGPGAGTANHLSPWVTTVAASTQTREFATTLTLTADNGDGFTADGASITAGVESFPVVRAQDVAGYGGGALCATPAAAGTFDGMIVACQRGVQARVHKGFNVLQGGAEAMVLYNATLADIETDNHWLPTIHLADGTAFNAFMSGHTGVTGSFPSAEERSGQGDVMAAFSSRGPAGPFLKPDVTAPGVQILAGNTPFPGDPVDGAGLPGELFQAIAGTSMSSPHVAGAAILVRAVNPGWTPGQVKSALMTTATTAVVKEDLSSPADPFDFGSGRIQIGAALDATLAFDETAANYFGSGNDPVQAVQLNVPSINAPIMPGRLSLTRVATNVSGERQRIEVDTHEPPATSIDVSPSRFSLNPGESVELRITIRSQAPLGTQQFGSIEFEARNEPDQHLPVAFIHTQGAVTLLQDCDHDQLRVRDVAQCEITATNNSFDQQTVNLDTFTNSRLDIRDAVGAGRINSRHVRLHNVVLAGALPGVPSVDPGNIGGYFDIGGLGIPAETIGDEAIFNYSVPPFLYNGQTWNTIGVDSNGYVVVGGGSAPDNNCCLLPGGPDPAPPNNMLAPFWTDLDGTGAPGLRVAVVGDGTNNWIVVQYEVNVFGTTDLRKFQVWIGVNGVQDIAYAYAAPQAAPTGQAFLVGAENVLGQGDMVAEAPAGGDLIVTSTDPIPGDEVSYLVFVRGASRGEGVIRTEMTASGIPGVTIVRTEIQVTQKKHKRWH
jgi:subtilisin family serine protease